eukprot:13693617-Alexandrium_andersonii.AAC.1
MRVMTELELRSNGIQHAPEPWAPVRRRKTSRAEPQSGSSDRPASPQSLLTPAARELPSLQTRLAIASGREPAR